MKRQSNIVFPCTGFYDRDSLVVQEHRNKGHLTENEDCLLSDINYKSEGQEKRTLQNK